MVLEGLAREEDLLVRVSRYGEPVLQQLRRWSGDPCLTVTVAAADLDADVLSEGELLLEVFAGPRLEPLLTSTLELAATDL